jgi:hypothetical protein
MKSNVYVYRLEYEASSGNCMGNSIVTEMDLVDNNLFQMDPMSVYFLQFHCIYWNLSRSMERSYTTALLLIAAQRRSLSFYKLYIGF